MQDTKEDKTAQDDKKDKESKKLIGTKTYGLGVMAKYSWTFVLGVTGLLTFFAMAFTKSGGEGLRNREKFVEQIKRPVNALEKRFQGFNKNHSERFKDIGPVVIASWTLATIIKHVLQFPAFERGRRQAVRANEKYIDLMDERDALRDKLAKYEGESPAGPEQAAAHLAIPAATPSAVPQATAPAVIPPLSNTQGAAPKMPDMSEPHAAPSERFADEHQQAQTHAGAVQDRKDSSPLIGAGV